jgi:DNA-binding NarL/FixJ family response regulator
VTRRKWHDDVVRVLVCDESPLVRRQVVLALEKAPDIEVLGEAPDGDVAVSVADQLAPDVAFLGTQLEPGGGIRTARRLRRLLPRIGLAMAIDESDERQETDLIRAIRAGVTAFVPRHHVDDRTIDVARGLVARRPLLDAAAANAVLIDYAVLAETPRAVGAAPPTLEPRERALLESMASGRSLGEASTTLGLSVTTASNLVANALEKLQRHARTPSAASTASGPAPGG